MKCLTSFCQEWQNVRIMHLEAEKAMKLCISWGGGVGKGLRFTMDVLCSG